MIGGLEGAADRADAGRDAAAAGDESVAPGADGAFAAGRPALLVDGDFVLVDRRAGVAADGDGLAQRPLLRHVARLEGDDQERRLAVEAGAALRQLRVEDAQVRGPELGLDDVAGGFVAGLPGAEAKRRRGAELGAGLDAHPGLGDDAEDALAADDEAVGAGAGAAAGQPPRLPPALRRQHARRLDEVVDVGVVGGVVAAGARRDPAAECRHREALGEMAQRVAAGPQLVFEVGAVDAGLDAGRARCLVDLKHAVEVVHVDGHDGFVAFGRRHAVDDGRAAAVGDGRVAPGRAPVEHGFELGLGARVGDDVGRVREEAPDLLEAVALGVEGALVVIGEAEVFEVRRWLDPRSAQRAGLRREGSAAA